MMEEVVQDPQPPSKGQKLYANLISSGFTEANLGKQDEFLQALQNPIKANKIYSGLRSSGFTEKNLGTLKEFQTSFAPEQPSLVPSAPNNLIATQQYSDLMPVLPQNRDEIREQQYADREKLSNKLKSLKTGLDPEHRQSFEQAEIAATTKNPDQLREPSKEEQEHYKFMQTPLGKTVGTIKYMGSKATKGALQVANGAAYLMDLGVNPLHAITGTSNPNVDKAFEKADKFADFGQSKADIQQMDDSKISSNLGGLAEFLPSAVGAAYTGGATFYLQGVGQGKEAIDHVEKNGAKINPLVKGAFILGTGAVNGALMGGLAGGMFKALPAGLRSDITASITANAIKEAAGKEITGATFKALLDQGAKTFGDKLLKGGITTLEGYKHAVTNLSALAGANFALKEGVDAASEQPVFNENLGGLAENLNDVATNQAPFFSLPGVIGAATKLTKYSDYKNSVVESLMQDSKPENVEVLKQDIADFGAKNGWRTEEIEGSIAHVDQLAQITKSLPKSLPENKVVDAVDLVQGRNELQTELSNLKSEREQLNPAVKDIVSPAEQLLTDKIEQANDKLKDIATGSKTTYSKGTGEEEGKFFKTINGKKEEITESRYQLENLERTSTPAENGQKEIANEPEITTETGSDNRAVESVTEPVQQSEGAKSEVPFKEKIANLFSKLKGTSKQTKEVISDVTPEQVSTIKEKTGLDIDNEYKHVIDNFGINHVLTNHGDAKSETNRGQIAITQADFERIPEIIDSYDAIENAGKNKMGRDVIRYIKTFEDGTTYYLEEIRNGKKELALNTMFKTKGRRIYDTPEDVSPYSSTSETASPDTNIEKSRQKAIDIITHGLAVPEGFKENDPSARIDWGMTSAEKRKAVADINKGNYETAPAKKLINKVAEFEANGEYPVIEGLGGSSIRRQSIKADEMNLMLDDVKANKIGELSPRQIEEFNQSAKELGITNEDVLNYERYRENTLGGADNGRGAESVSGDIQQPENDKATSSSQGSSDTPAQGGERTTRARNATTDEISEKLGVEINIGSEKRSKDVVEAEADKAIKEGYDVGELIDKIEKDKHEASDTETVILAKHLGAQDRAISDINKRLESEAGTLRDKDFQSLVDERARILNDFQEAATALKNTGRAIARGLGARRFIVKDEVSLADMVVRKREANKGEKLTPDQLKEVNEAYEAIKAKAEAYEKKIAKLQAQETDLLAKQALRKANLEVRNSKRSVKAEIIDKEIDDVFASIKKLAKEQRSTLSANPIPVEYIPEIAKLVKLYTQKGVNSIEGMVDNIYNGLKDDIEGLTKDHVKEAIGLAGEKDPTKAVKSRLRTSIADLKRRTEEKDFSPRKREPVKLDKEGLELRDALEKARYDYELALHRDALANRTKKEKARDAVTEIMNVPRALMASADFSAPLRQGLVMTVSHPIVATKAFMHMFKSAFANKTFDRWFYDLKESPDYAIMKEAKLYIADPHKPELAAKEEQFMTNLANKIPIVGKLVEGSERAYVGYLNKLRVDLFRQMSEVYKENGKTPTNNPDLYRGLAKFINNATGRGDFKNENMAQALNSILFSPRLIASRLNLLNPVWYAKLPKEVRRQAIGDMVKFFSVGVAVLALAQLNGADVETDPRSSDFGKIKFGDTRYDVWGGFAQYARLFGQLLTGETKSTSTGRIKSLNDNKYGSKTRLEVLASFARNKLSPVPAYAVNFLAGKDGIGQEFDPITAIPKSLFPLVAQDTYKAIEEEGLKGLFTTGLPATFGVGVQTYDDKKR